MEKVESTNKKSRNKPFSYGLYEVTLQQLQQHVFAEKQKWKSVTERMVEVISYLAKQNLALSGHRGNGISGLSEPEETIGDNVNVGNFLAMIRLLAKYDVILAEHVQSAKEKPKIVTYFSNRSQNEINDLLTRKK